MIYVTATPEGFALVDVILEILERNAIRAAAAEQPTEPPTAA